MAHTYRTLAASKVAIEAIGVDIARGGLPRDLSPFVFTFTGDGNVSQGAQEIFSQLPHRMVKPSDLKALVESKGESCARATPPRANGTGTWFAAVPVIGRLNARVGHGWRRVTDPRGRTQTMIAAWCTARRSWTKTTSARWTAAPNKLTVAITAHTRNTTAPSSMKRCVPPARLGAPARAAGAHP